MGCARGLDVAAGLLLALSACAHGPGPGQATLPDTRVALRLVDIGGETLNVAALRGQVVLLTVMTTWSEPAFLEVPLLSELQREYAEDGFVVVAVLLVTESGSARKNSNHLKQFKVTQRTRRSNSNSL